MKLDNGDQTYGSYCGVFFTVFFSLIMVGFAYTKMDSLLGYDDVDIIEAFQDNFFADSEEFNASENDFFVAAAITKYSSDPEPVERKEYGELLIEHYGWGNDNQGYAYGSHPLDNHVCTDEELGITNGPDTIIYPIFQRSQAEVL